MDLTTIVKASYAINAGCAIAMVGITAYCAKQQTKLNRTIVEGNQRIAEGNLQMLNVLHKTARR